MEEESETLAELNQFLVVLDENLSRALRHPNDRELRREAASCVSDLAEMKLPTAHGIEIDMLLIKAIAPARILARSIEAANKQVPATGDAVEAVNHWIGRVRGTLIKLSMEISAQLRNK